MKVAGTQPGCVAISYDEVIEIKGLGKPPPIQLTKMITKKAPMEVEILYKTNVGEYWKKEIIVGIIPSSILAFPKWERLTDTLSVG